MRLHDIAFFTAVFFLIGVFFLSSGFSFAFIALLTFFFAVILFLIAFLKQAPHYAWAGGLSLLIVVGAAYLVVYAVFERRGVNIPFDAKTNFTGRVVEEPKRGAGQDLIVRLGPPHAGTVLVREKLYPEFFYGDTIRFEGVIVRPQPENYAQYLEKEGMLGVAAFPRAEIISSGGGSIVRRALLAIKQGATQTFRKILPIEEASFISGLTLGERADFSKELTGFLKASGTTHLVALSGYNISIIGWAIRKSLGGFISRRAAFILTILLIAGFVVMAGAEASVVRAAIMGAILLLAGEVGRPSSFRNAITLTAFAMALSNPRLVRFDLGFELSFLALLGLVYIAPVVKKLLCLGDSSGFLSWRDNLATTIGAQLAVLPVLISSFNTVSLVSILANLFVLEVVPFTMGVGFLVAALGFISQSLAQIAAWFLHPFLMYLLGIIRFFGSFEPVAITPRGGAVVIMLYYSLFFGGIAWFSFYERKKIRVLSSARVALNKKKIIKTHDK